MRQMIFDAGGTKVSYVCMGISGQTSEVMQIPSGLVPYILEEQVILDVLRRHIPPDLLGVAGGVARIFYYGSGCSLETGRAKIKRVLAQLFPEAALYVASDMLGAARALCLHESGIAMILGTGSSACIYDGSELKVQRTGLGYILGDEGSGAHMGKLLLQHLLYRQMPADLEQELLDFMGIEEDRILDRIYFEAAPNRFLASLLRFINPRKRKYALLQALIDRSLRAFLHTSIQPLCRQEPLPLYALGGAASYLREELKQLADEYGWDLRLVLRNPLERLMIYHSE